MKLLTILLLAVAARADNLPPLPFNDIPDLGYADGYLPAICTDSNGNYTPDTCGANGYDHVYRPEAESPEGHWVGVAVFDMDIDAQLFLWHDGAYIWTGIFGSPLTVNQIDDTGLAQGFALACSPGNSTDGTTQDYYRSDIGCVAALPVDPPAQASVSVPEPAAFWLVLVILFFLIGRFSLTHSGYYS